MKEKILVPLDGTETGEAVFPHLEQLVLTRAPHQDVELTLLRVLSIINFNVLTTDERAQLPYSEDDCEEMDRNAYRYLEGVAVKLRQKGFEVTTKVKMGHIAEEIVKTANETMANLIAMTTHGRAGIVRWFKGSITDEVINLERKIPVLTLNVSTKQRQHSIFSFHMLQDLLKYV